MEKGKLIEKTDRLIEKLNNSLIIKAIMGGMLIALPAIMAGSVATILMNLQISSYQDFITSTGIKGILNTITIMTVNFTALYTVFGISYNYTKQRKHDAVPAGILGIVSFLLMTPLQTTEAVPGSGYFLTFLPTSWLGAQGVFSAMIIGFIVSKIYCFAKDKKMEIKLPESVPSIISSSFSAIIPGLLIIGVFGVLSFIFLKTPYGCMHQAIYSLLQIPIQNIGGSIWSFLLVIFVGQLLWVVGIHGPMVVMSLAMIAWSPLDLANVTAMNAGQELPNMIGYALYNFTTFAGCGIGLAICMLFCKSKRYKSVGKLSIVPAVFGITEPLIFGAPIVMNLKLAIPHVLLPVLSGIIGYLAIMAGILPKMNGVGLPTGTPIVVYGFLQAGWVGAVFQILFIIFWVIGWYPFIKSLDKEAFLEENKLLESKSE